MGKSEIFGEQVKKQTLSDQLAERVQTAILAGEFAPGDSLPTEPELAEQFGVSRAVVRDATRLLMARGLVDVQHGKGVFITDPENPVFGDSLLLSLRRVNATAWDVEQFLQISVPEWIALAAETATPEEHISIRQAADDYILYFQNFQKEWWGKRVPESVQAELRARFERFLRAILAATGNQLTQILAGPLLSLRNLRTWQDNARIPEHYIAIESAFCFGLVKAVESGNPQEARRIAQQLMELPDEAKTAMQNTPVGEIVKIPIPLPKHDNQPH